MIYILVGFFALMTYFVISIQKDIISPAFVFCMAFFVAGINVLTNIELLNVEFSSTTVILVMLGTLAFCIGSFRFNGKIYKYKRIFIKRKEIYVEDAFSNLKMILILLFNFFSIIYILREIYSLTVTKAYYQGSILGSLNVYAEVSKFSSIDMKVSTISTLLTALCEAEGYMFGYFIAYNLAHKIKTSKMMILCFITAFISTFCQGSRGGIFMILASVIEYIIVYKEKKNNQIGIDIIRKIVVFMCLAIVSFQLYGVISGKNWNVSIYEYFSVYLGDPLINLNTKLREGIERTQIHGICSFGSILKNILSKLSIEFRDYKGLSQFQYSEGHNLGNVYTIFAYLIADFGYVGMIITMFLIGKISNLIYMFAQSQNFENIFFRVLYSYMLVCIAFSFFSNKVCENISFYHIYMFAFVLLFTRNIKMGLENYNDK